MLCLRLFCCCAALLVCGCLSPTYTPPQLNEPVPQEFKHVGDWKPATPGDTLDRGNWWKKFNDSGLNELMEQLNAGNQKVALAAASFRQMRSQVDAARSSFFPTLSLPGTVQRADAGSGITNTYSYGLRSSWEVNFWNTIPAFDAAKAAEASSAADYATMRLAMQAELAQSYFQLRTLDVQHALYESTIAAFAKGVQLTRSQYLGGIVTPADVAQAEAQLAAAEAQMADIDRQRAQMESAIAILVGQLPSTFSLAPATLTSTLPVVPRDLPSALLERRPDIASAERQVAVANEKIGLARAAWFPSITLNAEALNKAATWMAAPITVWSMGPTAALSLFEGGKRIAESDAAQAGFEAAVATYRQTVLEGFKEVEDNLAALNFLATQAEAQNRAVTASQMALRLSLSQYKGGLTTYLQVVSTQATALSNQRSAIQIEGQRLIATVNLIKALGGGWNAEALKALTTGKGPQEGVLP